MPHDKERGKACKSSLLTLQSPAAVCAIPTGRQEPSMVTKESKAAIPFILRFH